MPIIHSLLEDWIKTDGGPSQLAAVRAIASESPAGNDPVAKFSAMVEAVAGVRRKPVADVYRMVGAGLVPAIIRAFPILIRANKSTMSLLMHINQLAPATLDAVLPGADPPEFDVELLGGDSLRLRFTAGEPVSALIEGVVQGSATHFGEKADCSFLPSGSSLPDKRLLEVLIKPERRPTMGTPPAGLVR